MKGATAAEWVLLAFGLVGCGGGGGTTPGDDAGGPDAEVDAAADAATDAGCAADAWQATSDGVLHPGTCPCGSALLLPEVRLDGAWRGAGRDGACALDEGAVRCPAPGGEVVALVDGERILARFEASRAATVEGLGLVGSAAVPGATGWISNGLQSWSQSGVIALTTAPSDAELDAALAVTGNEETLRSGRELSWFYSAAAGGGCALVLGAVTSDRWKPWVTIHRGDAEALRVRLGSGATGESVVVQPGSHVAGEAFVAEVGSDATGPLIAYADALPARRDTVARAPELGWNSWYELFDGVDEQDVRDDAALFLEALSDRGIETPPDGPPRIVVDDGWQVAWGTWVPNEKFPSGLDGLAADLTAQGLRMGLWLAPLLVDEDAAVALEHPDWLVEGASFLHPSHGRMGVLDVTNPAAAAHLQDVVSRIVSWGYDLLKIDFLFAGAYEGGRAEDVTGMQAYHRALELIREAVGEDVVLVAVGAPGPPSLTSVDAWRVGGDIAFTALGPAWPFIANQARMIAARWPLCRRVLCDADPPLLRGLPPDEIVAGTWVVALSGGPYFLSDDLRALDAERLDLGLASGPLEISLGGDPAIPQDLFPASPPDGLTNVIADVVSGSDQHVVPSRWTGNFNGEIVFNWTTEPVDHDGVTVIPAHSAAFVPSE